MCRILKNIPYRDTTKMNKSPRKILVFIIANISRPFESFTEKSCVIARSTITKIPRYSKENTPNVLVIIMNQNVNPAVTASALNLEDEKFILNWIDECYKTSLC